MDPHAENDKNDNADSNSRRKFLKTVTAMGIATAAYSAVPTLSVTPAEAAEIGPVSAHKRREQAFRLRLEAALANKNQPIASQPTNSDEDIYSNRIGSFSKTLPHNSLGEVDPAAYDALLAALTSGVSSDFEKIPLGGTAKLANPQASYAFDMLGPDGHHPVLPAAPALSSAQEASEIAEDYWAALTRDVPFNDYGTNSVIADAAANLSSFSDFRGPKEHGQVTPDTLFRGFTDGDLTGPYISQFLWKNIPYGSTTVVQKYKTAAPGTDYMTSYSDWLNIQNGGPAAAFVFDPTPRYIRSGRDMSEWLHRDFSYQGPLSAALILLSLGPSALDQNNPYTKYQKQNGGITLGSQAILDLLARVSDLALKACWFQKWLVHRRVRPEEFGGLVHNHIMGKASYPLPSELISGPGRTVLARVFSTFGSYLLPQAYSEGCPTHPAYPAGHATLAGACGTVLKWFFNESLPIPSPVVASSDGSTLNTYTGPTLTVGGELNKLASNASIPRDTAGVHWRTDGEQGMLLGEAMAIGMLQDMARTNTEQFAGLSLTKFDGTTITITGVSDDDDEGRHEGGKRD
jgi:hypothetical protein